MEDVQPKKRGGRREGAGKKKGTLSKSTQIAMDLRELYAKKLQANASPIIDALISKAKSGDVSAMKEIADRVMGKSVETVTHQGEVALKLDLF